MYLSVRKIWLAVEPVDMRMGLNALSQLVQNHLGHAIGSQCAYVFGNRSRTRLKVLLWDGTGVWCGFVKGCCIVEGKHPADTPIQADENLAF